MKLNPNRMQKTAIVAAITLSTACIVAFAQSAPPPPPAGAGPMGQHMGPGWRDGGRPGMNGARDGMRGGSGLAIERIAKLKNSLKLTPAQTALWDKAEKAMQPAPDLRTKMQEQMKARHDQTLAALADPKFDPRKFSAEMDKQRAERQAEMKTKMTAVREAWFSVYDSLDAGQRGQVREFLRAGFESRGRGMAGMRHWGQGELGGRGDARGDGRGVQQFRPAPPPGGPAGNLPPPPARP